MADHPLQAGELLERDGGTDVVWFTMCATDGPFFSFVRRYPDSDMGSRFFVLSRSKDTLSRRTRQSVELRERTDDENMFLAEFYELFQMAILHTMIHRKN